MAARKAELRKIVLDLVFDREQVTYRPNQFTNLVHGVAEIVQRNKGGRRDYASVFQPEARLSESDEVLVLEIFWDLIVEKVLTLGLNGANPNYPFFRLHSEASS